MTKAQFWILNIAGGTGAVLILGVAILGQLNDRTIRELDATQSQLNRAHQIQATARNLIVRLAQVAPGDAAIQELLARHELKVERDAEAARPAP